MMKRSRRIALLSACALFLGMTGGSLQAAVYDSTGMSGQPAASEEETGQTVYLLPGDSVANTDLEIDGEPAGTGMLDDGSEGWKNTSGRVYELYVMVEEPDIEEKVWEDYDETESSDYGESWEAAEEESTEPYVWYGLSAVGGTVEAFQASLAEPSEISYHLPEDAVYTYTDESGNSGQVSSREITAGAYYEDTTVTLIAEDTRDGLQFQKWAVYRVEGSSLIPVSDEGIQSDLDLTPDELSSSSLAYNVTGTNYRIVFMPVYAAQEVSEDTYAGEGGEEAGGDTSWDGNQEEAGGDTSWDDNQEEAGDDASVVVIPDQNTVENTAENTAESNEASPAQESGTGYQVDPETGYTIDPQTGYLIDPSTGYPIEPDTGYLIDRTTGNRIDPATGQVVSEEEEEISILDNAQEGVLEIVSSDEYSTGGDDNTQQTAEEQKQQPAEEQKQQPAEEQKQQPAEEQEQQTAEEQEQQPAEEQKQQTAEEQEQQPVEEQEQQPVEEKEQQTAEEQKQQPVEEQEQQPVDEQEQQPAEEQEQQEPQLGAQAESDPATEQETVSTPAAGAEPEEASAYAISLTDADTDPAGTTEAVTGTTITVRAAGKEADGLVFSGWTVEGLELSEEQRTQSVIQFSMPDTDVSLAAQYKEKTETVTALHAAFENVEAVDNGDGSVQTEVKDGATVTVVAAAAPEGQEFREWKVSAQGAVTTSDTTEPVLQVTVADSDVTVEPVYAAQVQTDLTLTVNSGSAAETGPYVQGQEVTITADDPESGMRFSSWIVDDAGNGSITDEYSSATTFTMGDADAVVSADYEKIPYKLTVNSGSGSGTYFDGDEVVISADTPKKGYRFDYWTITGGSGEIDSETSAETVFTMEASDATVLANYEKIPYTLTVKNGSGSGTYTKGTVTDIAPNFPASGKEFDHWEKTSGKIKITDSQKYYTTVKMKASDATVTAVYKDGPNPNHNTITGLENGVEYLKSTTLTFTAVGAGMENNNPNPGDYRYRPVSYQIGSVGGSWTASPYTTSMAINAVGDYTLTVTYAKDVYDGSSWNADGTTVTKSVTFHVVNALSVQTGDSSPLLPLAITSGVALAIILILIVVLLRRRRKH